MSEKKISADFGPVGVVGLGNMGGPISENLVKAGFQVIGSDLVEQNRKRLTEAGGTASESAAEVGKTCHYIILSLPSEGAFNAVIADLAGSCQKGTVVMECSTLPIAAKERGRDILAEKGITLLDTPLSGTGVMAKTRDLAVFVSGNKEDCEKVLPVFDAFCKVVNYVGEFGSGMKMKIVANQLGAIQNVTTAEGVLLGTRLGLDPNMLLDVIGSSAAGSKNFSVRGPWMVNRSWGNGSMKNSVFQKDLKLIKAAIEASGTQSPLFMATLGIYADAMENGNAEDDTSSCYAVLERWCEKAEQENQ